ncbi:MAG: hypothetical protein ACRETQ_02665 [Gammaproteobacteria bacterium]
MSNLRFRLQVIAKVDDFENIGWLVTHGGDVTLGRIGPVACAATASDEDQCLAMLVRQPGESLSELLGRLDAVIYNALENQVFADEINA